jgi:hypothetical protein
MVFQDQHFSQIQIQLKDLMEDNKDNKNEFANLYEFKLAFINGKKSSNQGLCHVHIPEEKL